MSSSIPRIGHSFGDVYPDLVASWHPTLNGSMTPFDLTPSSARKAWWSCPAACGDHVWEAAAFNRSRKGCPFCAGRKVCAHNNLAATDPGIAAYWHPTKNGYTTASDVTRSSSKKRWWKCPAECGDHEWEAPVASRHQSGCPFCSITRPRACAHNNLAVMNPDMAAQWHPTLNDGLAPDAVTTGSSRKVWWWCQEGCCDHVWEAAISSRSAGCGCPFCSGRQACAHKNLLVTDPDVAARWHPTLNGGLLPIDVLRRSEKVVWWLCSDGCCEHVYDQQVGNAVIAGCPVCDGKRRCPHRNLEAQFPAIAAEAHPVRNGDILCRDLAAFASDKLWWLCPQGHEYESVIASRTGQGTGCSRCTLGSTSRPEIHLRHELSGLLGVDIQAATVTVADETFNCDLVLDEPQLGLRMIIEYDGYK